MPEPVPNAPLIRLRDLIAEGFDEATKRHDALKNDTSLGPKVALSSKLSRAIGGRIPLGVSVMHGAPGTAKTALVNQLAAEAGCPSILVTCEMRPLVLLHRHAARVTKTFLSKFTSGELPPDEWKALIERTVEALPDLSILDGTRGPVPIERIRECAEEAKAEAEAAHLLVVIDSAHSWVRGSGATGATEYDATNAALQSLQRLSADQSCSVFIVAEQNRASMGTDRQEASAGSRVYEYSAELIVALTRDREAKLDTNGEVPILATLAKNRHGDAGERIDLRFSGRLMTFREGDGIANVVASGKNGSTKLAFANENYNGRS
jgi:replicative DNA helicase